MRSEPGLSEASEVARMNTTSHSEQWMKMWAAVALIFEGHHRGFDADTRFLRRLAEPSHDMPLGDVWPGGSPPIPLIVSKSTKHMPISHPSYPFAPRFRDVAR